MGNENSTTTDKHPKTSVEPDSLHRDYQPPVTNDKRNNDSAIQSKSKPLQESVPPMSSKRPVTFVPITDQSFNILGQNPPSPVVERQRMSSRSYDTPLPNTTNNTVSSNSLEKAPLIQLNYVVQSSNNDSLHTYRPDNITVMHRTSSQSVPYVNRWYDNDYNKNVKPLTNK